MTYHYDAAGRMSSWMRDEGGDEQADERATLTYNEAGLLQVEERDGGEFGPSDGAADVRFSHYYDQQGNLVLREQDTGVDGVVDVASRWILDESGHQVGFERLIDGNVVRFDRYTVDSEGRWISAERDLDGDGEVDERCLYAPPCLPPGIDCDRSGCQPPNSE